MGTNWAAIIVLNDIVTYFDSLGVKFIPQEIEKFIGNKNITTMMCGYLCIGFINFMLYRKKFLEYTNFFTRKEYGKNGRKILKYFK